MLGASEFFIFKEGKEEKSEGESWKFSRTYLKPKTFVSFLRDLFNMPHHGYPKTFLSQHPTNNIEWSWILWRIGQEKVSLKHLISFQFSTLHVHLQFISNSSPIHLFRVSGETSFCPSLSYLLRFNRMIYRTKQSY